MSILRRGPKINLTSWLGRSPVDLFTIDGESKSRCIEISDCVVEMIEEVRSSSETAVLEAGEQLASMFELAQQDNELAVDSLHRVVGDENANEGTNGHNKEDDSFVDAHGDETDSLGQSFDGVDSAEVDPDEHASIRTLIGEQKVSITDFLDVTSRFLQEQTEVAGESYKAVYEMEGAVDSIQRILLNSKILAVNAQIEAKRLGDDGKAVYVLGGEMARFTKDIESANEAIQSRVSNVTSMMLRFRDEAMSKQQSLQEFSARIEAKLDFVQKRTDALMESLEETSEQMVESQSRLTVFSHDALSALQFQDPMSQKLRRVEHEVEKLRSFLVDGQFTDTDLADVSEEVGHDGAEERETGVVDLF